MSYKTVSGHGESLIIEKKSRFIGNVFPISAVSQAEDIISSLRKTHYEARHNCYAYILRDGAEKCSDDGEPQKTAGAPIMQVLKSGGFTDIIAVVTRYFGGTLLGTGGLVRAYGESAAAALKNAGPVTMCEFETVLIECGYSYYEGVCRIVEGCGGEIQSTEFSDSVKLTAAVSPDMTDTAEKRLTELTSAKIMIRKTGIIVYKGVSSDA